MKKYLLLFLLVYPVLKLFSQGFTVENYSVEIFLNKDGYFDVTENYDLDFSEPKHGIYRDIITKYDFTDKDGKTRKHKIEISDIKVPDEKFSSFFPVEELANGYKRIKIGDPNQFIFGQKHYQISYRVKNALIIEDSLVQFYWNLKPADWQTGFNNIRFKIHPPEGSEISSDNSFTYSGAYGNPELSSDFEYDFSEGIYSAVGKPGFVSEQGESVTVLMKFPRNKFPGISKEKILAERYGWLGILAVLLLPLGIIRRKFGSNKKLIQITSYYPPENIDSAMAGLLLNKQGFLGNSRVVFSLLPYWGSLDLLTIGEKPRKGWFGSTDFLVTKKRDLAEDAPEYQKDFFNKLFEGVEKDKTTPNAVYLQDTKLRSRIAGVYMNIFQKIFKEAKKFYDIDARKKMRKASCLSLIFSFGVGAVFIWFYGFFAALFGFLILFIFGVTGWLKRKRNERGDRLMSELKGFYNFIKMAEADRIKVLLEQDPYYFETTMPFAMAFGMLNEWAARFNDLETSPPSWYKSAQPHSSSGVANVFSSGSFINSMGVASKIFSSASVYSPPGSSSSSHSSSSSSGGGHSGGGFGGGGGGSW